MKNKTVTLEKWFSIDVKKFYYWIVDENLDGIDGFSRKRDALEYIKNNNMLRLNKTIKERF